MLSGSFVTKYCLINKEREIIDYFLLTLVKIFFAIIRKTIGLDEVFLRIYIS